MRSGHTFYKHEAGRASRDAGDAQAEANRLRRALEAVAQWAELPTDLRRQVMTALSGTTPRETVDEAVDRLAKLPGATCAK